MSNTFYSNTAGLRNLDTTKKKVKLYLYKILFYYWLILLRHKQKQSLAELMFVRNLNNKLNPIFCKAGFETKSDES
jgi:hypothetical protein